MEIIIKNDSDVKITICKDETFISSIISNEDKTTSVLHTPDSISVKCCH